MQDALATTRGERPRMRAAEIIGRRIVSGDLLPGTTLPDCDQLAAELSTSRLSVREAVRVLADKGLVSSEPHHSAVVQPRSQWSRLDCDVLLWQIADEPDSALIANLFEVRRIIEPDAAAIVAMRGAPAAVAAMEQALLDMAAAAPPSPESIEADLSFHRHLLAGTSNEFIAGCAGVIDALLRIVLPIQRKAHPTSLKFVAEHAAVLEAIKSGDAGAARKASLALLQQGQKDALDGTRMPDASGAGTSAARSKSQ